ncbi:MAG: acyl-CoA dehydrogenase family protein, partial [Actinomycetota bacterium]|nr:acyl-CoA dehydrogenase family protein [Actinomycetota bacterium]
MAEQLRRPMSNQAEPGRAGSGRVGAVGGRFAELVTRGRLEVGLPGRGATAARWRLLAELAGDDLDVARLAEAHLDALAILDELEMPALVGEGSRWAVWAAEPPNARVAAERDPDGRWELTGVKRWCSGAHACTDALVTADTAAGGRLFAVDLSQDGVHAGDGGWLGLGMAGCGTESVEFVAVPAVAVGVPRAYLDRVGFWLGAIGVAACWYGGAVEVGRPLWQAGRGGGLDPHARAHLGVVDTVLSAARLV